MKWQVIAVNHTRKSLKNAKVTAETYDLSGRRIASPRHARVDVGPAASVKAFTAAPADGLPDLHLLRLTLTDDRGQVRSRNTYWRSRTPGALRAVDQVQQARLSASRTHVTRDGDRREATATVRNRGSMVAAMVRLSLLDQDGTRVLPTLYDDNYLWLPPVRPARSLCPGRPPPWPRNTRGCGRRGTTLPRSRCAAEEHGGVRASHALR